MKKNSFILRKVLLSTLVCASLFATTFTSCVSSSKKSEKEILVVSFGTSYNESREATIGAIENAIAKKFSDYTVRRAFTSDKIISILKKREGLEIDTVKEALDRAVENGVKTLVVQPTHLMHGYEYTDLKNELDNYKDSFEKVVLAEPLLNSDEDFLSVAKAVSESTKKYIDGKTAVCFMGHGTEAASNEVYAKLQTVFTSEGLSDYYIGTVEAEPDVYDLLNSIKAKGIYTHVVLQPLMVVAGDHANNDMAGDEDDSWKSVFKNAGFDVDCILEGLGQNEAIQNIYVSHTQDAIKKL